MLAAMMMVMITNCDGDQTKRKWTRKTRLGNLSDGRPQDIRLRGFLYLIGDTLLMQKYPLLNGDLVFTERNGPRVMRTPHITNPKLRPALVFMGRNGAFVMWEHFWKRIKLFYDQEFPHITQGGF